MATNTSDFFTFSKTAGTAKNLQKPTDGGDNNLWGGYINVDLDTIVGAVNATSDLIADANQNELVDFTATGSAVNHVGITNAATGNGPTIEAKGDDSNVDLNVKPKGTGAILLKDGDGNELVKTSRTASAVNEITVANAATGNGPTLSATGDDTNIDLNITPKGSGNSVFANKISTDDIIEKTSDHGVEIDGLLIKDSSIASGSIADAVTQPDAYYVQGKVAADGDIGANPLMLNLNGTSGLYVTWTGQTTSFGDGSSKVTGTNDYDFKFIQKGIYFVSFSLSGEAITSNRHELIECQIRGGSSSHSTTTLARAIDGIQNADDARSDYGGCTATLVRQFNANDLINFLVDSDQYANFKLIASTHISIFLIRALA